MFISIFTPAYNRRQLIERLYKSLLEQTNYQFEWIVVDDGSTDGTELFFAELQQLELPFKLVYHKKENAGKHIAINVGVKLAQTPVFFIVDTDDYLTIDAVETIQKRWIEVEKNSAIAGIVFNRCTLDGNAIGNPQYTQIDCSPLDFRYKFKEKGDKAEVIRTSIFEKYPFPETAGEKFCPEALFFNRLKNYCLRYINKNIYMCEYQPGGLTSNIFKVRKNSPVNTCMCYGELVNDDIPAIQKLKAMINFYRFERYSVAKIELPFKQTLKSRLAKSVADLMYLVQDKNR
ncbi:glycosyltransferase family 2 protein [Pedobacter suwonensis]|uniref:glycosyltransferase family 2 protein n=1 Tax=Pedobacter suwonensis TaxID=332999 RepID=UPI0025DCED9A|nr:glycosyltransferase family 2 protein [uncultured Pedobacter sp.]